MSTVKINNILGRVKSTGVRRFVKTSEGTCRDSKITTEGFDDAANARVVIAICQLKHVICALASGKWAHWENGKVIVDAIDEDTLRDVWRSDVITWVDVCDCLYDYVPDTGRCVIRIKADAELQPFAPPRVHVSIVYDAKTRMFWILNLGKLAPEFEFGNKFSIDAGKFFKTDADGEIMGTSHEDDDFEAEMFFKSRSMSQSMSSSGESM